MKDRNKVTKVATDEEIKKYELLKSSKKCPNCGSAYFDEGKYNFIGEDTEGKWYIFYSLCPSCGKLILYLCNGEIIGGTYHTKKKGYMFKPLNSSGRPNPPKEIPSNITNDYREACLTLQYSPKASAALSRRCLQNILNEKSGIKEENLSKHIKKVISQGNIPTYISDALDFIRLVGNFAAHPIKSKTSGEIVDVEPGEAEYNLDVIELLFDFYFVQPEIAKQKKQALNKKLQDAGKPTI